MQILERTNKGISTCLTPSDTPVALALGFFDGVHIGHRSLLARTATVAAERALLPAAISFRSLPHKGAGLLSEEERLSRIFDCGILRIYLFDFAEIRTLSPEDFAEKILRATCRAACLLCGESFRFGKNAAGTPSLLQALLPTEILPPVLLFGEIVSATRVKAALEAGEAELASHLLGMPYRITGQIVHGKAMGRTLGFPTLNLPLDPALIAPRSGVYLSEVTLGNRRYFAVTNIGLRPTLEKSDTKNAESHLFGFAREAYGEEAIIELLHFLRPERHFSSPEELKTQVESDKEVAKKWMKQYTEN